FRATAKGGEVVNSMKLHENCDCHELCYCLEGSIEIKVKDKTYQLSTNDVILFDGAFEHEYTAMSKTEYIVIHLPKNTTFIETLLKSKDMRQ
ncbi:cupin domain-containing protein, partial [Planctomycetota bacterium]